MASEGIKNSKNKFVAESDTKDAFGHVQLGGVAPKLASLISNKLNLKNHWAVADYLQRSGRHIASLTDLEHASAVGKKAVEYAVKGLNGVMPIIVRKKQNVIRGRLSLPLYQKLQILRKNFLHHLFLKMVLM